MSSIINYLLMALVLLCASGFIQEAMGWRGGYGGRGWGGGWGRGYGGGWGRGYYGGGWGRGYYGGGWGGWYY
ncbi:unnamed protein product [Adineta steineri]|uniref:Uncharacterized protein n=1 Tax=Adineta steineri TaxID=433720 RepID=A0A815WSG3_9BILA|nr:unnamed protein product [Adineta steineri]CAF1547112.1 unnamed protein product [Adineta steineri]